MGALLSAAVPRLRSPEEANLRAPDAVVSLHVSFINAGADLIETNTFGATAHKLQQYGLEGTLHEINAIRESLVHALIGIYHQRISYPGFNPPSETEGQSANAETNGNAPQANEPEQPQPSSPRQVRVQSPR